MGHGRYLLSELNDQRQLVGLDKSQEGFFGQLSIKSIATLIKLEIRWKQTDTIIQSAVACLICL